MSLSSDKRPPKRPRSYRAPAGSRGSPIRLKTKAPVKQWSFGGITVSIRVLVAGVVVMMLAIILVPLGLQYMEQEQAYRDVNAEVAAAEERNDQLAADLAAWDNENYVAAQARERLGYVRPGETQFILVDPPGDLEEQKPISADSKHEGPAKPWMMVLAEAMQATDFPPASEDLGQKPSVDPKKIEDEG